MPVPLVPVKALAEAKGLAPEVGPLQRRLLAIAMFEDVVAALQAVPGLGDPVVVSPTARCGGGPTPWAAGWSRSRRGPAT